MNNSKSIKKAVKIAIVEDDKDIFTLWTDFLSRKGYRVINKFSDALSERKLFETETPDLIIMDYKLPEDKNGIDIAIDILNKHPSASILFITAHELIDNEISKHPIFHNKRVQFLLKPVKLRQIEYTILDLLRVKIQA